MRTMTLILSAGCLLGALLVCGCSKSNSGSAAVSREEASSNPAGSTNAGFLSSRSPLNMQIKWVNGRKYPMHMELEQITKTTVPNQSQPVVQTLKLSQNYNFSAVKQLDNGGHQLELTFENETLDILVGDQNVFSFDSARDPSRDTNNPVAPMLRAMYGMRIEYITGPHGEYQRIEGLDELRSRIPVNAKQQERGLVDSIFSEESLKQYCSFADSMPDHPVRPGDTWRLKKDIPSRIGILSLNLKCTFKDWQSFDNRNCARVDLAGDISSKTVSTEIGAGVNIEKGKISGQHWFDPALGMIVSASDTMTLDLKITTRAEFMKSQFTQNSRMSLLE